MLTKKKNLLLQFFDVLILSLMDVQINLNSVNQLYSKLQLVFVFDLSKSINRGDKLLPFNYRKFVCNNMISNYIIIVMDI